MTRGLKQVDNALRLRPLQDQAGHHQTAAGAQQLLRLWER